MNWAQINWFVVGVAILDAGACMTYLWQHQYALSITWGAYGIAAIALMFVGK